MQLTIAEARDLVTRALLRSAMAEDSARAVADHLIDGALCGHEFSGVSRVLAIIDEFRKKPPPGDIRLVRETATSALLDGGDNTAYVVSLHAVDKAVELARKSGIAAVCATNTWFSGRLAYYVERGARQGFVTMHTTNTTARVAPYGGIDRVMGTNPFAIAFPSLDDPVVIDIGTSATSWGDVVLAKTKGDPLPEGVAVDPDGRPTREPDAALAGAFLSWGGPRGGAVSLAVQLLGILAGSAPIVREVADFGLFFLAVDPGLFQPAAEFRAHVSELRSTLGASRPVPGGSAVRMPGDNALRKRKAGLAAGVVQVDDRVYARLREIAG